MDESRRTRPSAARECLDEGVHREVAQVGARSVRELRKDSGLVQSPEDAPDCQNGEVLSRTPPTDRLVAVPPASIVRYGQLEDVQCDSLHANRASARGYLPSRGPRRDGHCPGGDEGPVHIFHGHGDLLAANAAPAHAAAIQVQRNHAVEVVVGHVAVGIVTREEERPDRGTAKGAAVHLPPAGPGTRFLWGESTCPAATLLAVSGRKPAIRRERFLSRQQAGASAGSEAI